IHRLQGFDNRPEHPCPLSLCERGFEISLPAAFTAALLNNQPFYSPAVPVHDAQLHGLRPHQRFRRVGVGVSNFCDPTALCVRSFALILHGSSDSTSRPSVIRPRPERSPRQSCSEATCRASWL